MQFLIRADQPFDGRAQSILTPEGKVRYTDGLTVEQYERECGFPLRVVDGPDFDELVKQFEESRITEPTEISEKAYDYALDVLPPSRFHRVGNFLVFHICEPIFNDLVSWYAAKDGRHWEWTDRAGVSDEAIAAKLRQAVES